MVPVIDFSKELTKILNYNEEKVQRGVADCIHAGNFLQPKDELNFHEKFQRFENLNELRPGLKKNTLHLSLNFHPKDGFINDKWPENKEALSETQKKLIEIAALYMERIGFADQPYLVYQHFDAAHPHIHIVSTLVKPNGGRVPTHNIAILRSVPARDEIDKLYGLRSVKDSDHTLVYEPTPVNAQKVVYGKAETKKAIKDVLRFILPKYKYTSLPELNAVLQQYNVLADRGAPDSRIYRRGGLIFRVLDNRGNKVGVPIKASDFHFKATLKELQIKFEKNEPLRKADIPSIKGRIDWALGKQPKSFNRWLEELQKEGIIGVVRRNEQGIIYGLTYIDTKTKSVVNGSDIGKAYSAKAIAERFNSKTPVANTPSVPKQSLPQKPASQRKSMKPAKKNTPSGKTIPGKATRRKRDLPPTHLPAKPSQTYQPLIPPVPVHSAQGSTFLGSLFAELPPEQLPYELTIDFRKKKKKKKLQQ